MKDGKHVIIREFGHTPLDAITNLLEIQDQPFPPIGERTADEVIIGVQSAAVGWVDLLMTSGQYQHMPAPPYCPGLEYAGNVLWAGANASCTAGDRVIADGFLTGPRSRGAHQAWGGFASYAVAPKEAVLAMPPRFSYDEGANFLGNYETAYYCLFQRGALREGETVLILGATGSTGLAAVHLAKLVGARTIAVGRSKEKLSIVSGEGADHVICTGEQAGGLSSLREEVKRITHGRGVDVIYDAIGGDASVESLRCAAFGARFLIVGWAATPFVAKGKGGRGAPNANFLPTNLIMMKGISVLGCPTVIGTQNDTSIREKRLADLFRWADEGRLKPVVSKSFALSDVKEAMRQKWESRHVGGIVLHPQT